MLQVIKFILDCIVKIANMLFSISLGDGLNLGVLMCFCFILLPITHRIICFIRQDAIDEINDNTRSRERLNRKGRAK